MGTTPLTSGPVEEYKTDMILLHCPTLATAPQKSGNSRGLANTVFSNYLLYLTISHDWNFLTVKFICCFPGLYLYFFVAKNVLFVILVFFVAKKNVFFVIFCWRSGQLHTQNR